MHPISVLGAQEYSLLIDYHGPECYHVLATSAWLVSSLCTMLMSCDDISGMIMIEVTVIHPLMIVVTNAILGPEPVSAAPLSWTLIIAM